MLDLIGKKLADVEDKLNSRFGKRWFTCHIGMPGNIDYDPGRLCVWIDDDSIIRKIEKE